MGASGPEDQSLSNMWANPDSCRGLSPLTSRVNVFKDTNEGERYGWEHRRLLLSCAHKYMQKLGFYHEVIQREDEQFLLWYPDKYRGPPSC